MCELRVELRTPPDDVSSVHELLAALWEAAPGIDETDRMMFETALIELASNVVQHATSARRIELTVDVAADDGTLSATITDTAEPPDVDVSRPRAMPDQWAESGRGIAFIQALVDEFHYRRVRGQNVWRIARTRESP